MQIYIKHSRPFLSDWKKNHPNITYMLALFISVISKWEFKRLENNICCALRLLEQSQDLKSVKPTDYSFNRSENRSISLLRYLKGPKITNKVMKKKKWAFSHFLWRTPKGDTAAPQPSYYSIRVSMLQLSCLNIQHQLNQIVYVIILSISTCVKSARIIQPSHFVECMFPEHCSVMHYATLKEFVYCWVLLTARNHTLILISRLDNRTQKQTLGDDNKRKWVYRKCIPPTM